MSNQFRKVSSLLLAFSLGFTSVPAHAWTPTVESFSIIPHESALAFNTAAINAALVWARLSPHAETLAAAGALSRPSTGSRPNLFLTSTISTTQKDLDILLNVNLSNLGRSDVQRQLVKIMRHQDSDMANLELRTKGAGASLYTLLESAEDKLLTNRSVDLAMISFPLLQAKQLSAITGNIQTPDELKDGVWAALKDAGIETAMSGGRIIVLGIPANQFAEKIYPIIELFLRTSANNQLSTRTLTPRSRKQFKQAAAQREAYLRGIRMLKFYASHVNIYANSTEFELVRTPRKEDDDSSLDQVVTPAVYASLSSAQRRAYVDRMERFQTLQKKVRSRILGQLLDHPSNPGARRAASSIAEDLLTSAFFQLNAYVEAIEKAPAPVRDIIDEAARDVRVSNGVSEDLPILDEKTVLKTEELLNFAAQSERGTGLADFYEAIYLGRQKAVPILNYDSGRLPRLTHILPTREWAQLGQSIETLTLNRTPKNLASMKENALVYYSHYLQSLIYTYRTPRYVKLYRLDLVEEVAQADQYGLIEQLFSEVRTLMDNPILQATFPTEIERLQNLLPLRSSQFTVVKRDVGDEIMVTMNTEKGYQVAMIELNKFNARQQEFPPDDRDSLQHGLQENLIQTLESRPWISLAEALTWWQANIVTIAPEFFQITDKVNTPTGVKRLPLFELKDRRWWEAKKFTRETADRFYVQGGIWPFYLFSKKWKQTFIFPSDRARLIPIQAQLSAAVVVAHKLYRPDELLAAFIELSESVVADQKKIPDLLTQVAQQTKSGRLVPALKPAARRSVLAAA